MYINGKCNISIATQLVRGINTLRANGVNAKVQGRPAIVRCNTWIDPLSAEYTQSEVWAELIDDPTKRKFGYPVVTPQLQEVINQIEWPEWPSLNIPASVKKHVVRIKDAGLKNGRTDLVFLVSTESTDEELTTFIASKLGGEITIMGNADKNDSPDYCLARNNKGDLVIID